MKFFTLENKNGLKLKMTDFGAIVSEIHVPDRDGVFADVALGFDSVEEYVDHNDAYFGAVIGRYGNRIGKCRFSLDGNSYGPLHANNGDNHLHGGQRGFDKVVWEAEECNGERYVGLRFRYASPDGEEGYPGNLLAAVTYKLTEGNEWIIEYEATTDAPTVYNPTNHSYFNLSGHASTAPLDHMMQINATHFTATDKEGIPTGAVLPVGGTTMDFRVAKPIGQDVDTEDALVASRGGFDHNFVIDKAPEEEVLAAVVWDPKSGREMKVYTTEPGVQFYTGNFLDGSLKGKGGHAYEKRTGFCLETQHFPDSPNIGHFPSTCLRPGQTFRSRTVYAFGVQ